MKIVKKEVFVKQVIMVVLIAFMMSFIQLPVFASDIWPEPSDISEEDGWPNTVEEANNSGSWPDISEIPAKAWIVIDAASGEVIIANNQNERLYPASTTKIMTALLALSDPEFDPDRVLTASANAVDLSWDSSSIDLQEGETIRMQDALAGLMIASGNDSANVIAENLAGSVEEFAVRMTDKAIELGATQTSFKNPHGLHDEQHYTTAADLSLIASAAMQLPAFRKLVSTISYSLPASNKHQFNGWKTLLNTNRLLHFNRSYLYSEYIYDVVGIKTGTTSAAGFCLVSAAKTHDGRQLISVLLGVPMSEEQGNTWIYSRSLLEAAAVSIGSSAVSYDDFLESQQTGPDSQPTDDPAAEPIETTVDTVPTETGTVETTGQTEQVSEPANELTPGDDADERSWLEKLIDAPGANFWFWLSLLLILIMAAHWLIIARLRSMIRRSHKS